MKILNCYAGLGGNRRLWNNPEYKITAVEKEDKIAKVYKENYPEDELIIGDAKEYLLNHYKEYDFIWLSPPCQSHSRMQRINQKRIPRYPDLSLYEQIILLKEFFHGKWIVENVIGYYKPIIRPNLIFDRHYIWCNFNVFPIKVKKYQGEFIGGGCKKKEIEMKKYYGIEYQGSIYYGKNHDPCQVLRNCVHPEIGLHILNEARKKTQLGI